MTFLTTHRQDLKVFAILAAFATIALFLVSPDSYTHDLYQRNNSAWFFMCGKAWMNGMVPYADFSDSKGPLLWLIYGVGYLISNCNYVGVFWVSCLFYWVTYFFAYKTANLFLNNKRHSLLCAILMTLFFFNGIYHREIKTEDFVQPFMMGAIYFTCLILYGQELSKTTLRRAALWIGVCFGATFLMKYNITIISLTFIGFSLHALHRDGHNVWRAIALMAGGVALVWLPFLVYFVAAGDLQAFVYEYFINVFNTVSKVGSQGNSPLDALGTKLVVNAFPLTMQCVATLAPMVILFMPRYRSFPFVAFLVSAVINMGNGHLVYYFNSSNALGIFGIVGLVLVVREYKHHVWPRRATLVIMAFILFVVTFNNNDRGGNYFTQNGTRRSIFYYYASLMMQVPNPTIVYYRCMPNPEFGVVNNSMPGCKYWALQAGATPEMKAEQTRAVDARRPDFIAVGKNDKWAIDHVTKLGYQPHRHSARDNIFVLFSKAKLKEVDEKINVSNIDVLLKRPFVLPDSIKRPS